MVKITLEDNSINYRADGAFTALPLTSGLFAFNSLLLNDLLLELG